MNAQDILQDQIQLDFRADILNALTIDGGINDRVSTELSKLSNKKSHLINQLKKEWEDRAASTFLPPAKIIEINLAHQAKLEDKGKFHDISRQAKISERNLILESGFTNFGFDPTTKKFTYQVAFSKDPSMVYKRFEVITEVEPNSQSVNIFATLRKYIVEFKELHMKDNHICQVFLHFSKTFLPNNFSSLSRFGNDANEFFFALLSLGDSEIETTKIRMALRNLKREFKEPISVVLLKIDSLYTALYQMSQPTKSEQDIKDLVMRHKLFLIGGFISTQALKLLMVYSRERSMKNRQLTLEEIVTFLNRIEQNVSEAALQNVITMPKGGELLDTVQTGAHTLNVFQQLDSDTVHGVFAGAYSEFHNKNSKKNFSYNKHDYSQTNRNNYKRGFPSASNYRRRPASRFPSRSHPPNNSRSFPSQRGHSSFRGRGHRQQQFQRKPAARARQQSFRASNQRRPRSPYSRSPTKHNEKGNMKFTNLPRSRSNSLERRKSSCLRCGRMSHLAASCPIYTQFCDTFCRKCNLLHRTAVCRESSTTVHLGQIDLEEPPPVEEDQVPNLENEEQFPNLENEVGYGQEDELSLQHSQQPDWEQEDWNLYDNEDYYDTEDCLSPFDLY